MCLMKLENMSEFNFKSSVCTDKEQSERFLALGLKKETADCYLFEQDGETSIVAKPYSEIEKQLEGLPHDCAIYPAWSLHRLIKLAYGNWDENVVPIYLGNSYDMLIGRIEFQVKQGRFNKEYLV